MIRITVLYPNTEGSYFDMNYYLTTHIPLVKNRLTPLGLLRVDLEEGLSGAAPGTLPPYRLIGSLSFDSIESLQKAMATHGEELIADIANYTNIQAQMMISQVVEPIEMPMPMATVAT